MYKVDLYKLKVKVSFSFIYYLYSISNHCKRTPKYLPLLLLFVVAAAESLVTFKFRFRCGGGGGGDDVKSILGVVAPGAPVTKTVMNKSCVISQKIKVGGAHDLFAFSFSLRLPKINFNFGFSHELFSQ